MVKVTKDLIRRRAIVARAKAYFQQAREEGWHIAATEVLRHANAKPPLNHRSTDIALIQEAATACHMTSTFKRSVLVFHPPQGRVKDNR